LCAVGSAEVGSKDARKDAVDGHPGTGKPARKLEGEVQISELGLAVGLHHAIAAARPVQIVEVHRGVHAGSDIDDTGRCAGLDALEQEAA
jgi:hypothetical protein